jgi:hypothetical protein
MYSGARSLGLQIADAPVRAHGDRPNPAVDQLGQRDADIDQRALNVLAVVIGKPGA